jgi:hypothetical protein
MNDMCRGFIGLDRYIFLFSKKISQEFNKNIQIIFCAKNNLFILTFFRIERRPILVLDFPAGVRENDLDANNDISPAASDAMVY